MRCHRGNSVHLLSPPLYSRCTSSFFLEGSGPATGVAVPFMADSSVPCMYGLVPIPSLNPLYILRCSSSSYFRLGAPFALFSTMSSHSVLHPPHDLPTVYRLGFLQPPSILSRLRNPTLSQLPFRHFLKYARSTVANHLLSIFSRLRCFFEVSLPLVSSSGYIPNPSLGSVTR